jgi:hypothetical protein
VDNPAHDEGYLIQHYVIKFVSDQGLVFSGYSDFLHNKADHNDIVEILLKVVLNTITLTLKSFYYIIIIYSIIWEKKKIRNFIFLVQFSTKSKE